MDSADGARLDQLEADISAVASALETVDRIVAETHDGEAAAAEIASVVSPVRFRLESDDVDATSGSAVSVGPVGPLEAVEPVESAERLESAESLESAEPVAAADPGAPSAIDRAPGLARDTDDTVGFPGPVI